MDNDILFIVLKKCYERGLLNPVDITPEFREIINPDTSEGIPHNWLEIPKMIFEPLEQLGYIHIIVGNLFEGKNEDIPVNWIDFISVNASLKPEGLLFYNSWNQMKVQERANKLSRNNILITVSIAIATFITIIYQKIIDRINDRSKQEIGILKQQVSLQKQELKKLKE